MIGKKKRKGKLDGRGRSAIRKGKEIKEAKKMFDRQNVRKEGRKKERKKERKKGRKEERSAVDG